MSFLVKRLCSRKTIQTAINNPLNLIPTTYRNLQIERYKSKSTRSKIPQKVTETESEDDTIDEDTLDNIKDKHTKIMKVNVPSMRVDTLLKAGLGIARNKLEVMFYESKIRVNGEKIPKKSVGVREGDEIDVVKGATITNPDFLIVARVEILGAKGLDDSISVTLKRCKSLTIENYEGRNKWTQSQE